MSWKDQFPVTDGVTTYLAKPDWYGEVDFDNPQRQYHMQIYVIATIGNVLMVMFLGQRLYTKIFLTKGFALDDGLLVLSWVLSLIVQGFMIWSFAVDAQGVHAWEMPIERYEQYLVTLYVAGSIFMPCSSLAKISILIFYLNLSQLRWFKNCVWAVIAIICIYSPIIFFMLLFTCRPISSAFDLSVSAQECLDGTTLYIATAVMNILTDVLLFVLPIPMIIGLKMPKGQKVGVIAVFAVGSATVITSIVRTALLPDLFKTTDQTWATASPSMWSCIESNLIVICGSFPTLRKFFRHFAPSFMGGSRYASTENPSKPTGYGYPSRKQNGSYAKFGEDFEMSSYEKKREQRELVGHATVEVGGHEEGMWDTPSRPDDDSEKGIVQQEKGIMQTKTYTVRHD